MVAREGCSYENEGGGTGGAVLVRTRVVARGRGCSCENEGGGTGGGVLVRTRVVAREGLFL